MIEEVLEEQSDSPHNFVEKVLKDNKVEIAERVPDKKKDGEVLKNRITYRIESADRQRLALLIGNKLGKAAIPIYSSDGSTVIGHKTKGANRQINFKYVLKPTKRYSNEAEKMELVIASASGDGSDDVPEGFEDRVPKYKKAAALPGAPLAKLETQKLPAKGLYDSYGVKSGVPKTDLIGKDEKAKYSVKKAGGSQFVSAQGPESAALWHIALVNSVGGQQNVDAAVTNALNIVPDLIKKSFDPKNFKDVKDADTKDKAEIFQAFKKQLFDTIIEKLGLVDNKETFKKAFAMEGYSGQVKFGGGAGSANKILIWSNNPPFIIGNPKKPAGIEEYVEAYKDKISIRVSDRGGNRGGAIRGEILNRPVQNESIVIEVVDDKEQEAFEDAKRFIKSNNITPEQMKKLLQLASPAINESVGNPAVQAQSPLLPPEVQKLIDFLKKHGNAGLEVVKGYIDRGEAFFDKIEKLTDTAVEGARLGAFMAHLNELYERDKIVKFLDALINDEQGGKINMRPLYEKALKEDVQFGDFEEPDVEMPPEGT